MTFGAALPKPSAMVRKRYPLVAYLLALAVALTGFQMAFARAQPQPVGQMVICSGLGLTTVMVDADGAPVAQSHVCPDGLLTLFLAAGGAWEPPERLPGWVSLSQAMAAVRGQGLRAPGAQARDPPVLV